MASTDAKPVPAKNTAYRVTFPILDADGDLVTAATALDSEVSLDGGTFSDCTNEATEIASGSGVYYLDLTSGEMNADTVAIIIKTTTSGAKTTVLVMYPSETGDIPVNVTAIAGSAVSTSSAQLGVNVVSTASGAITATSIATDAIGAAELAADAVTEIANAVWDMDATGHQTTGTFGQAIGDPVADTNTIFKATVTDASGVTVGTDSTTIIGRLPTTLVSGRIDASVGAMAADVVTATAIATDAIGSAELAASAATEIANAVWDTDATGHQTGGTFGQAIGDPVADTNTIFGATVTDATGATVGVDTTSLRTTIGAAGAGLTAIDLPNQTMDITGNLSGSVGSVTGSVGSVASGGITAASIATGAIDADALAADAVDEIFDEAIMGSNTLRQLLRGFAAAMVGKSDGFGTATIHFRNVADTMNVVTATVDVDGNRTAVTLDLDDTP